MLKIKNLSKHYGSHVAVKDFSLDIKRGEFISFVGPSGCGKTTILKMCSGLIKPTSGSLVFDKEHKKSVVFQRPTLLPWKTVKENVALPFSISLQESPNTVNNILSLVHLQNFTDFYPQQLSGGMQQRVEIARALVTKPDILFMDEPFSALDAFLREKMQDELLTVYNELQPTILFITHSIEEAVYLSKRVVVLSPSGSIKKIIDITLDRRKDEELRTSVEFLRYVACIRKIL